MPTPMGKVHYRALSYKLPKPLYFSTDWAPGFVNSIGSGRLQTSGQIPWQGHRDEILVAAFNFIPFTTLTEEILQLSFRMT
jgi:hypothetical protein